MTTELSCCLQSRAAANTIIQIASAIPGLEAGCPREARAADPVTVVKLAGDASQLVSGLIALREHLEASNELGAVHIESEAGYKVAMAAATDADIQRLVHGDDPRLGG
jgi:hypothetical protein